jgi:mortality factor 4-like protein 1
MLIFCTLNRWDEWVPESRVLEHNEKNLAEQKRLRREHPSTSTSASKAPKGGAKDGGGGSTRGTRKDGPRGMKRGREEVGCPSVVKQAFSDSSP